MNIRRARNARIACEVRPASEALVQEAAEATTRELASSAVGIFGISREAFRHITQLLAGVSLATVFNVAQDIALSALTTAQFLNSVAQAMIANGQVSQQAGR